VHPALLTVFGESVPAYFVMLAVGFLFATAVQAILARSVGIDPDAMVNLGISMLLWGLVGSRALHVLCDGHLMDYVHMCTEPARVAWKITAAECTNAAGLWDPPFCHPRERDCLAWAKFWNGGLAYYGGFIAASMAAWFNLRKERLPFFKIADIAAVTIPLGLTFGRLGCFLGGCCFGKETQVAWAATFPAGSDASHAAWAAGRLVSPFLPSAALHPAQLYEAAASLAISAFCAFVLWPRRKFDGQVFAAFLALYAAARFVCEFFRADDRGAFAGLSTSQWIGLGLVPLAGWIYRSQGAKSPAS
jgi:phosphatidylglycerol---prolipoprotein diacylglyceryl transferase